MALRVFAMFIVWCLAMDFLFDACIGCGCGGCCALLRLRFSLFWFECFWLVIGLLWYALVVDFDRWVSVDCGLLYWDAICVNC